MLPSEFTPEFLKKLELLQLRSRRAYLGSRQGGHTSLKRGHGIEFSDYRKYELGDNPRHIDWGVFARSERLYVKRFQEEQDLSVFFVLDGTCSMNTPASDGKWNLAKNICLALSYVALMQHDTVFLSVPGQFDSPAYSGGRSFHILADQLSGISAVEEGELDRKLSRGLSRIRFPGVAILVSDLLMPFEEIVRVINMLRAKNLDITVIQVLGESDVDPLSLVQAGSPGAYVVDSETGEELELTLDDEAREEYGYLLMQHNRKIREFLVEANVHYQLALSSYSVSEFIFENLSGTGLGAA